MTELSVKELAQILPVSRKVELEYMDPLDTVWTTALERMGIRVLETRLAYAEYDGKGTLAIGTERILDPDDCMAQIILHEICHWLVEGREAVHKVNWGVTNTTLRDLPREYASLRLQAALTTPWGLRRVLANTTDHRAYYDGLAEDPLARSEDGTTELAQLALLRAQQAPWEPILQQALEASFRIVAATAPFASPPSLYSVFDPPERR